MEHSPDEPNKSSSRMSGQFSELPSAKVLPKDNFSSSTYVLHDRSVTNSNTEGTQTFRNGYANYLSDSEDSVHNYVDFKRTFIPRCSHFTNLRVNFSSLDGFTHCLYWSSNEETDCCE